MGKSAGTQQISITDYRMSLYYGFCHGPVDETQALYIGEKSAWSGNQSNEGSIIVNAPNLFGGPKKEGGAVGIAYYLPGDDTQVLPEGLASKVGLTTATCPGFRGIMSVFFVADPNGAPRTLDDILEAGTGTTPGFLWSSNNPYLQSIWMTVKRAPRGLGSEFQMIGTDANPAAIIYEALTNSDWGMGASDNIINTESFETAAQTLLDENFGMSMIWTKQTTIEDFVSEIIDHVQATLFVNPRDGLMTIKLIRDDFDVDTLPVLTPDNCEVTSFNRKAWGETTNEIVVTWTNPENEQEETVTAQDLANITIQGAVISDSRNYYGVRNADLAMRLAKRDIRTASAPIATFEIEVDRSAWDFVPGGCVKLDYPEYGIDGLVLRIGKIDYGKPGQPTIKVSAIEDIFSLPVAAYTVPDSTQWVDPSSDPEPIEIAWVITTPAYFVQAAIDRAQISTLAYPEVLSSVLATQDSNDVISIELATPALLPNGDEVVQLVGDRDLLGSCLLTTGIAVEATTLIASFSNIIGNGGPTLSGFMFIGATTEDYQEIALIQTFDVTGYTLQRGVLDTVPRAWPSGTRVWFVPRSANINDTAIVRGEGEAARYKLLTRTSRGVLDDDDASVVGVILSARPHLPNRPANVTVEGVSFGSLDVSSSPPLTLSVAWANRNRTMEDGTVLAWTEGDMPVETGQTTTVAVYKTDGTLVTAHNGLTGTAFSLPLTSFGSEVVADVKVTAKRDGLESLQGAFIRVKISDTGWGDDYGEDWGGGSTTSIPGIPAPPLGGGDDPDPGAGFPDLP